MAGIAGRYSDAFVLLAYAILLINGSSRNGTVEAEKRQIAEATSSQVAWRFKDRGQNRP